MTNIWRWYLLELSLGDDANEYTHTVSFLVKLSTISFKLSLLLPLTRTSALGQLDLLIQRGFTYLKQLLWLNFFQPSRTHITETWNNTPLSHIVLTPGEPIRVLRLHSSVGRGVQDPISCGVIQSNLILSVLGVCRRINGHCFERLQYGASGLEPVTS